MWMVNCSIGLDGLDWMDWTDWMDGWIGWKTGPFWFKGTLPPSVDMHTAAVALLLGSHIRALDAPHALEDMLPPASFVRRYFSPVSSALVLSAAVCWSSSPKLRSAHAPLEKHCPIPVKNNQPPSSAAVAHSSACYHVHVSRV
jgi:hypothetical protein